MINHCEEVQIFVYQDCRIESNYRKILNELQLLYITKIDVLTTDDTPDAVYI